MVFEKDHAASPGWLRSWHRRIFTAAKTGLTFTQDILYC